jgi:hypothetical protein
LFTESSQLFTESGQLFTESSQFPTESSQLSTESGQLFMQAALGSKGGGTLASSGLLSQALCSVLQQEISDYFRLMAVLEGQSQVLGEHKGNTKGT